MSLVDEMPVQLPGSVEPIRAGFLQLPRYSAIAFATAVEPLRMANYLSGKRLYEWRAITLDGTPVAASNGLEITPCASIEAAGALDLLFVCGGINVRDACEPRILAWLRELARQKVALGAVCTGAYVLARAGVLKGYRCTIHWENISSINEELRFPHTAFSHDLFVIDRDRFTSSGGTAPLDMMLTLIARQFGRQLSEQISEEFVHDRIRTTTDVQRVPLRVHLGMGQPKLVAAVSLMEANIDEPLDLDELAFRVQVSRRQLERLFKKYLLHVPARYYLGLRLERARQLLTQTSMSIIEIAAACGFASPSHFSRCYHDFFARSPSSDRGQHSGGPPVEHVPMKSRPRASNDRAGRGPRDPSLPTARRQPPTAAVEAGK